MFSFPVERWVGVQISPQVPGQQAGLDMHEQSQRDLLVQERVHHGLVASQAERASCDNMLYRNESTAFIGSSGGRRLRCVN